MQYLFYFLLPWLDTSKVRSATFRPIYKKLFWLLVIDLIVLTWVGGKPAEGNYILIGRIATIYYFAHFIFIMPIVGLVEKPRPLPNSISQSVLANIVKEER